MVHAIRMLMILSLSGSTLRSHVLEVMSWKSCFGRRSIETPRTWPGQRRDMRLYSWNFLRLSRIPTDVPRDRVLSPASPVSQVVPKDPRDEKYLLLMWRQSNG